jgi:hypothetical protein
MSNAPRRDLRRPPLGDVLFTAVAGRDRLRLYFSRVDAAWQHRQVRDALQPHHRSRVLACGAIISRAVDGIGVLS